MRVNNISRVFVLLRISLAGATRAPLSDSLEGVRVRALLKWWTCADQCAAERIPQHMCTHGPPFMLLCRLRQGLNCGWCGPGAEAGHALCPTLASAPLARSFSLCWRAASSSGSSSALKRVRTSACGAVHVVGRGVLRLMAHMARIGRPVPWLRGLSGPHRPLP